MHPDANGATYSDTRSECWAEFGMTSSNPTPGFDWETCLIGDLGTSTGSVYVNGTLEVSGSIPRGHPTAINQVTIGGGSHDETGVEEFNFGITIMLAAHDHTPNTHAHTIKILKHCWADVDLFSFSRAPKTNVDPNPIRSFIECHMLQLCICNQ